VKSAISTYEFGIIDEFADAYPGLQDDEIVEQVAIRFSQWQDDCASIQNCINKEKLGIVTESEWRMIQDLVARSPEFRDSRLIKKIKRELSWWRRDGVKHQGHLKSTPGTYFRLIAEQLKQKDNKVSV
jgi:hypothetical protein